MTGENCDECKNSLMTGENCDECKNSLMTGANCDECKNSLMTGANCNQCKNNKLGQNCDIDTVVINGKTWAAKNMNTTIGNDGSTLICYANTQQAPDGDPDFIKNYGCLYIWTEALQVCPSGWRLPTEAELSDLANLGTDALRATTWIGGLNTSGFGALPAGYYEGGHYYNFGSSAGFWSSTEGLIGYVYRLYVDSSDADVNTLSHWTNGFSVRCLKD